MKRIKIIAVTNNVAMPRNCNHCVMKFYIMGEMFCGSGKYSGALPRYAWLQRRPDWCPLKEVEVEE